MRFTTCLLTLGLLIGSAAGAQDATPNKPMQPGNEPRPVNWNNDGAPRPPRMWKGHGEAWPQHYKACRERYGPRYNKNTDMVTENGRRSRCSL